MRKKILTPLIATAFGVGAMRRVAHVGTTGRTWFRDAPYEDAMGHRGEQSTQCRFNVALVDIAGLARVPS